MPRLDHELPDRRRGALRLGLATIAASVLLLTWLPGLLYQARDVDVLLYSAAAVRANAEGALPYVAAWIEKGPLAMGLYQALFLLFGPYNLAAVGGAWVALALLGTAMAWALAREIGGPAGALWAAALYAVSLGPVGGTLNTEVPASVAAAAAVLLWCRAARSPEGSVPLAAASGALAAAAFLCRQNAGAVLPVLVAGEAVLWAWGRRRGGAALLGAGALAAGFLAVSGLVVGLYAAAGALDVFWFCFRDYNVDIYVAATRVTPTRLLGSPLTAAENFLLPVRTAGALGLVGIALAAREVARSGRKAPGPRAPAMAVAAASAIALTLSLFVGLRFFSHYFALPLPLWSALGGLAVGRLAGAARRLTRPRLARGLAVLLPLLAGLSLAVEVAERPWRRTARELRRWAGSGLRSFSDPLHWPGRDPLAAKVAAFIRETSGAGDGVFVWGMRPHVYAYARRVPATRFVTCTFLTGLVPWERSEPEEDTTRWIVPGSWELLMADLEAERPLFVVDASRDHLFGGGAYVPERFPRLAAFLSERYEPVFEAGGDERMVVWRRRDGGPAPASTLSPPRVQEDLEE